MIQARAAITDGSGNFSIEYIQVDLPHPNEVLVQIQAAGICHTDWSSLSWEKQMVLGHEGAGIVLEVGKQVTHVKKGDQVLLNWAISCGHCFQCLHGNYPLCESDRQPHQGATLFEGRPIERSFMIGTLSTHTLVRKEAVIPIDIEISHPSAAILGCGVMTGYGSAVKVAKVTAGSSTVIIGCGGVGLNVIQGCRISGAEKVIAVDLSESRLAMARQFGATHLIQSSPKDKDLLKVEEKVKALTELRGADYAFECTGVPALGAAPLRMIRNGGTAVQVSGIEEDLTIDMNLFEWDKTYINPLYGKCNPAIDFPNLFRLYQKGALLLDEMITNTYPLEKLSEAFEDMLSGKNAKGAIIMPPNYRQ